MLTVEALHDKLTEYKPPFHHHIRDEIRDEIISYGEDILEIAKVLLDENEFQYYQQGGLLENALWKIGGEKIIQFFIEREEGIYIKKLSKDRLLQLRDDNPELIKEIYNYLPEEVLLYCEKHQYNLEAKLQELALTIPELPFDISMVIDEHGIKNCPICDKSPENQRWLYIWTPNEDWIKMRGRAGWFGICDDCNIQVNWVIREMN